MSVGVGVERGHPWWRKCSRLREKHRRCAEGVGVGGRRAQHPVSILVRMSSQNKLRLAEELEVSCGRSGAFCPRVIPSKPSNQDRVLPEDQCCQRR